MKATATALALLMATGLLGCTAAPAADPEPAAARGSVSSDSPTTADPSPTPVEPRPARMPEVPLRLMFLDGREGVLVGATGVTRTGLAVSAYVPTRSGAVFASGDRVYRLDDGGRPVPIGRVAAPSVFLQVDPTLRYVLWPATLGPRVQRTLVYDTVRQRVVFDRRLRWIEPPEPPRVVAFGEPHQRLVQPGGNGVWTFATVSGRALVIAGGPVVTRPAMTGDGPADSRAAGVWSPGLRYRAAEGNRRRPWRVLDLTTGADVTPAGLDGSGRNAGRLWTWLGNDTFAVLTTTGPWRHSTVTGYECRVADRCRLVLHYRLNADDGEIGPSNEIG